ncbi:MAG: 16S rRNA (cytidine(1402)-2'-O)-methyltransferase [Nitrospinae bacterium]|nr:16S rRNA (cytidine(1402)-2'-O)-methyltransferase [Nitrospinota bacterium]
MIENKKGILYLVSTHIGNPEDITLRALKVLKECDIILCEEFKPAGKFLRPLGIKKPLISINEHNEEEGTSDAIKELLSGKKLALISDAGSPLFSDPGNLLLQRCKKEGVKVSPLPGASSLIPALQMSGCAHDDFYFAGWLSPKTEEREQQLRTLKKRNEAMVIMETPYRLKQLLTSIDTVMHQRKVFLALDISGENEEFLEGTAQELLRLVEGAKKRNFVLILEKG